MSGDVRQIFEAHHCYFETSPYYVDIKGNLAGDVLNVRRVQTGFDLDIYGVKIGRQPDPPAEYWLVYNRLKEVADGVRHEYNQTCSLEVVPFGSALVLDTGHHLQPRLLLRIRVIQSAGIDAHADAAAQQALNTLEAQLGALGVKARKSGSAC
jgi:hypothetical protein